MRTNILDAARELFAQFGYDEVTMRKVAEKIEYSPTTIYLYFRDKETLIRALCAHDFLELAGKFQRIALVRDRGNPRDANVFHLTPPSVVNCQEPDSRPLV